MYVIRDLELDLQRFAEGAGGGDGGSGGANAGVSSAGAQAAPAASGTKGPNGPRNALADVQYGTAPEEALPTDSAESSAPKGQKGAQTLIETDSTARKAEFDRLIKSDYKDLFQEKINGILSDRFKGQKALEEQAAKAKPIMEMLGSRYGVDPTDMEALQAAMDDDDSYLEQEAIERDMPVKALREMKRIERENAELLQAAKQRQMNEQADAQLAEWVRQGEEVAQTYPGFDLRTECNDPETGDKFLRLLHSHVDVQTAYEVVHRDEIMHRTVQYAARQTEKEITDNIRARGLRPNENGGRNNPAVVRKTNPHEFSRADREEISRRVMRGERITL